MALLRLKDLSPARNHGWLWPSEYVRETASPIVAPCHIRGLVPQSAGLTNGFWFPSSAALDAGTGDCCVEGYFSFSSVATGLSSTIFYLPGWSNLSLVVSSAGRMGVFNSAGYVSGLDPNSSGPMVVANQVTHYAVTRASGTCTLWLQGASAGTWSASGVTWGASSVQLGSAVYGSQSSYASFAGLRVTAGNARYSAAFTPAYAAFPSDLAGDALWGNVALMSDFTEPPAISKPAPFGALSRKTFAYSEPSYAKRMVPPTLASKALTTAPAAGLTALGSGYRGLYKIAGTVKAVGTPDYPVGRLVRLFAEREGVLVDATWSDPTTGAYEFLNVKGGIRYTVVSYDYLGVFRAVVADNQLPVPM